VRGASTATPTLTSNLISDPDTIGRSVPNNMPVKVGQAIQWDWRDPSVQHSVTSDDGTTFDSCLQNKGYKFIVTFSQAGSIPYRCSIHPSMVGTITVTK
jgi:plastocyanin